MIYIKIILFSAVIFLASTVLAENRFYPWDDLPESFIGMQTGKLQPANSIRLHGGAAQTSRQSSGGQTGRQTYFLGLDYRGQERWQLGTTAIVFDDEPAHAVAGSIETVTHLGMAGEIKYQWLQRGPLSASLLVAAERTYFSRGAGLRTQSTLPASKKSSNWMWTVSLPTTLQITDRLWLNSEVGYTSAPKSLLAGSGFGDRASFSGGAVYQATRRAFIYGALKHLERSSSTALDIQDRGGPNYIYTLGTQLSLTPQSSLNFYATNAFSQSPVGDDILFYPDKNRPTLGIVLSYIPSGAGIGDDAPTYWVPERQSGKETRFSDGFTMMYPHTLASDRMRNRCTTRLDGNFSCTTYFSTDPDFQFEFSVEDFVLREGSEFRSEASEGLRYMIGGRWQAMDEAYGHPLSMGFRVSGGRDLSDPQIGILYTEGTASKAVDWGELAVGGRAAFYSDKTVMGLGLAARYDLADDLAGFGELTVVKRDEPVWSAGYRWKPSTLPFELDIFATNSIGLNGIGSILSNKKPSFGMSLHFENPLDLF